MDRPGIVIAGVCVYGGVGTYDYEVELMDESGGGGQDPSHTMERWSVMEVARGTFGPDDSVADIVEIKFERPVPVKVRKLCSLQGVGVKSVFCKYICLCLTVHFIEQHICIMYFFLCVCVTY